MVQKPRLQEESLTLEKEIKTFADSLPYWAKYLSWKILVGNPLYQTDIDTAYKYLLEDGGLAAKSNRVQLNIDCSSYGSSAHKHDLVLTQIENVEGVNALVEGQTITFGPAVTVVYGANGSGKTGYIRLMKTAFFSRASEKILPNVHVAGGHKHTKADFVFESSGASYSLGYPHDANEIEFEQFAVFDTKSVLIHLNNKNQFEFRPAGLNFFGELTKAYKKIEEKITANIEKKNASKDYASLFDGESDIRTLLNTISAKTNIEDLKKHIPLTESDTKDKAELEEEKARLVTLKKDKEIKDLNDLSTLVKKLKQTIEDNNKLLAENSLSEASTAITDSTNKEALAKKQGVEAFKIDVVKDIGGPEWKSFIEGANEFAKQQAEGYPVAGDPCLLCRQPLSEEAIKLISSYWTFLKSQAELEAKNAQALLDKKKKAYEKLDFALLPEDGVLNKWLKENYSELLETLNQSLVKQKTLSESIISAIVSKIDKSLSAVTIDTSSLDSVVTDIENRVKDLQDKDPTKQIEEIDKKINYLTHKDKLQQHISHIEDYINSLKWAETASGIKNQLGTRKTTDKEKDLSDRYFGQSYMTAFKDECQQLDGNFGINVKHTGASGTSYRELKIKDRTPSDVLSEGEQKIISLADFLSEIRLSQFNNGIIFDDPVNSLDEERKSNIAKRLVTEACNRQVVIFTHDLVFLSSIVGYCEELNIQYQCHWMEEIDGKPGTIWLNNAPSFEKTYKKSGKAQEYCDKAKKCAPEERESLLKTGFAALRTSYEALVVFDLFKGVVQRFNERVSINSLSDVYFDTSLRDEVIDSFYKCCRFMEGHSHSDKYAYKKPNTQDLHDEIQRFNEVKKKIKSAKVP